MKNLSLLSEKLIRSLLLLMVSFWLTSSSFATLSGTYTINNTAPTGGTNFHSFSDAVSALNAGITGSVTFMSQLDKHLLNLQLLQLQQQVQAQTQFFFKKMVFEPILSLIQVPVLQMLLTEL